MDARHEVVHAYSSHAKARAVFGDLISNVSLVRGLEEMARWAKTHGSRQSKVFRDIEVTKNMPPAWQQVVLRLSPFFKQA